MDLLTPAAAEERLAELLRETAELRAKRGQPDVGSRIFYLQLDTINLCNLQCRECIAYLIRDVVNPIPMPREVLHAVAEQVFPYCRDVNFAALAEPWMSPVIEDAIDLARSQGVPYLQMISNGLLLTEPRARKLIDIQFDRIAVSTDAATPEKYARIRGAALEKLVSNVARLRDLKQKLGSARPMITFNFVMMRSNLREMPAVVDLAHELGAEMMDFRLPFLFERQGLADELPSRDPGLMDEMILKTRERITERGLAIEQMPATTAERRARGDRPPAVNRNPGARADGIPHCDVPWGTLVIGPTGDVYPCCSPFRLGAPSMGNLDQASFAQILTGPAYARLRSALMEGALDEDCAECKAMDCLATYDLNGDYFVETGPRMPIAGREAR